MRKTVEPPPVSQCNVCGGQLTLKRVLTAHSILGETTNVFACANCGHERSFVVSLDVSSSRFGTAERRIRA